MPDFLAKFKGIEKDPFSTVQALMSTNLYNFTKLTVNVHDNRHSTYFDCNFVTLARPFGVSLTICANHNCGQVLLRFFPDRSKTCITIHYGSTSRSSAHLTFGFSVRSRPTTMCPSCSSICHIAR